MAMDTTQPTQQKVKMEGLNSVATVLLGLGAVLIAWGTYQSAW